MGRETHMDDNKIVELYWERREEAIKETALKYGRLCTHIAKNILLSCEDSEECVNDTYFAVSLYIKTYEWILTGFICTTMKQRSY